MENGRLANLDDYIAEGDVDEYFGWTIDALRSVNGELGCLWHNTDTPLVFYDTTVIATPPSTWSELRAIAENVKAETGQYGMSYPIMHWAQFNMGMFNASGGQVVDETGKPVLFEGENRAILAGMFDFYADLFADGLIPAQNATSRHNDHLPAVYAGDVAMFLSNSNANVRSLQPNLPEAEYANWRSAPPPSPDGVAVGNFVAGGWFICPVANDDPAVEAAAAAWALHATGPRANRDTNKAGGWLPTRMSVYAADPFFRDDHFLQTAANALDAGGWTEPFAPIYPTINNALNAAMSAVGSGQATVEEALATAEADVMREYAAIK
jgi:multiple sugar transport system substrate-binding protein